MMDAIRLSQNIATLTASLNIKKTRDTDFQQWLQCLCKLCYASNAYLTSTHTQQQYQEDL